MKKSPTYQYHVGGTGWAHADWLGSFYPEDLPLEWQLMFYNNVFSCAYLPYMEWSQQNDAVLAGWADNVTARFRFVLEANPHGMTPQDLQKMALLGTSPGLLVDADGTALPGSAGRVIWLEKNHDLKHLVQSLQSGQIKHVPVFLISRQHDLETMHRAATLLEIMAL